MVRAVEHYHEFSMHDIDFSEAHRDAAQTMLGAWIGTPFAELLSVYQRIYREHGAGVQFDGYLGDVLQRGLYLTHGGVYGAASKLLPALTLWGFDGRRFLAQKYSHLPATAQTELLETYDQKARDWHLDEFHRVVLFEILYGRGARNTIAGGGVLASQFFTVVQPFTALPVFRRLFATPATDWLHWRRVRALWRHVPDYFAKQRTYSGFAPTWPGTASRTMMLLCKGLSKARLWSRASSYEDELRDLRRATRDA
jgi:hypothetical protein